MHDTLENSPYSKLLNDILYDFVRYIFITLWPLKETLTITTFFSFWDNLNFLHIGKFDYT